MHKNDLHELISHLSRSEKRYFKIFAQRHVIGEVNNYTRLFDAIARQTEYDENRIRRRFRNEKFVKHLSSEKHQLYKLIMRSLRAFHSSRNEREKIRQMVVDVRLLEQKRLYKQCLAQIRQAKAKAWKYECFDIVLTVLDIERRIVKRTESKALGKRLQELREERRKALRLMVTNYEYYDLYDNVYTEVSKEFRFRKGQPSTTLESLVRHPRFRNRDLALTFDTRLMFHSARAFYFNLIGNHEHMAAEQKSMIENWRQTRHQIEEDPNGFKKTLFNYLASCHHLGRYGEFPSIFEEIATLPKGNAKDEAEITIMRYFFEVVLALNTGNLVKAKSYAPEIESIMTKHPGIIRKTMEISLYYNLSIVHFLLAEPSDARAWLNRIIHQNPGDLKEARRDLQRISRLFLLILYFEEQDQELADYLFRSTYRYFYRADQSFQFENAVLKAMRKLYGIPDREQMKPVFSELKGKLDELAADPEQQDVLGLGELRCWLRAKLSDCSVYEAFLATEREKSS